MRKKQTTMNQNISQNKKIVGLLLFCLFLTLNSYAQTDNMQLSTSINSYSICMYKKTLQANKNILLSPISSYISLMAIYEGSNGRTQNEFKKALLLKDQQNSVTLGSLTKEITNSKSTTSLNISNAIWLNNNFSLKPAFEKILSQNFATDFSNLNFSEQSPSATTINNWVTDKTNGYIKNIISPNDISKETAMVLTNAIYFKGKWKEQFEKSLTLPDDFYSIDKSIFKTDFMHQTEMFQYYDSDDYQFVSLPYQDHENSLCIILPKEKYGIQNIDKILNTEILSNILSSTKKTKIKLTIPKFKIETSCDLQKPLQEVGLKKVFTTGADLSGISEQKPLFISGIRHKTFISIDEEKTVAAGATATMIATTSFNPQRSEPIVFKADHPFLFFIYNNKTKTILFIGRYVSAAN